MYSCISDIVTVSPFLREKRRYKDGRTDIPLSEGKFRSRRFAIGALNGADCKSAPAKRGKKVKRKQL
jgi:hypothetical protein